MLNNSRFNEKGSPTIYLGQDIEVALSEVQFPQYFNATTSFGVEVNLQFILDLSDTSKLSKSFGINKKLFRSTWKNFNNIRIKYYTQYLSDHLRSLPIEGFLYESVQRPGHKCLCLFPDKMIKGSSLKIIGNYKGIDHADLFYDGSI